MKRSPSPSVTPIRLVIIANLSLIAFLYAYIQWRFSTTDFGAERSLRLNTVIPENKEVDLQTKASQLERLAIQNLARDREMRRMAPPVDWEAIAEEGAAKIAAQWDAVPDKVWYKKPGYHLNNPGKYPPYPFQMVTTSDGKDSGVVLLAAPFFDDYYRAESARALFWRLKAKGHIMVGITSYQEYPGKIMNPYDNRHVPHQDAVIHNAMDAWLHCFREPDKVLPPGIPRLLLSESDFYDPDRNDGGGVLIPNNTIVKRFDLVHSNQGADWNDFARNWTLAKASFISLIKEFKDFKILIMGKNFTETVDKDLQPYIDSGHISWEPRGRPWRDFLKSMQTAKTMFVPNVHDGSPRVIAEAMCLNLSVVINTHIIGGWKYATKATGELFSDSKDVVDAFRKLRDPARAAELSPRKWYQDTWGKTKASFKLQAFLEAAAGEERLKSIQRDLEIFKTQNS